MQPHGYLQVILAFAAGLILAIPAAHWLAAGQLPAALTRPRFGAAPAAWPAADCQWSPMALPMEAQVFAVEAALLNVPTLVGTVRRHLSIQLAQLALLNGVPGDFLETGVYQGGTATLLLKTLDRYDPNVTRRFWAADSFEGLPEPTEEDLEGTLRTGVKGEFQAGLDLFMNNVRSFNISNLDQRMKVLKGWFVDTLPSAPIEQIAYLRLDGDLYASTMDALEAVYDKVSPGGLIYVDDYGSFSGCRQAVDDFRRQRRITAPLMMQALPEQLLVDPAVRPTWESIWWIKPC